MNDSIKRIEEKTDQILAELVEIKVDVARHIMRTDLLEENVSLLRADVRPLQEDLIKRLTQAEIKKHNEARISFLLKTLGVLVALATFLFGTHLIK